MITEVEKNRLKAISSDDHAKDIAVFLNERGIRPRRSKEYNARTITRVLRGDQEDINAEWGIFHYYHELNMRKQETEEKRKILTQSERKDSELKTQ